MTLADDFTAQMKWPPPGYGVRLRELANYNRIFECDHAAMREWVSSLRRAGTSGDDYGAPLREFVPFPAPEIAARTLATFLFGEDAKIKSEQQPDELLALIDGNHFHALNQEAATTCAVEGDIVYKLDWDEEVSPVAIISAVAGDMSFPRFRFRRLVEVAFVRCIEGDDDGDSDTVIRHVEIRQKGRIINRLFRGSGTSLGVEIALESYSDTAELEAEVATDIDDVLARHVPFWRTAKSPFGISIFRGKHGLIEALHSLYTQDQHDAEMAKRRVALPSEYLKRDAHGRAHFDRNVDVLELSDAAAGAIGGSSSALETIEFTDNTVMGERIAQRLDEFMLACGIAPQSAGRDVAHGAESGTARRLAQSLTLQTVHTAARYFEPAIEDLLRLGLVVGARHLGTPIADDTSVDVEMQDGLIVDEVELAGRIQVLATAQAISTEQKVRSLHPDWAEDEIAAEVGRIREDEGLKLPAPLAFAGGGAPTGEPSATGGGAP